MNLLNAQETKPQSMSFALTIEQIKAREKTVTRRNGCGLWSRILKPGDLIYAVEKTTGLQKNEKEKRIATLKIVSVREEPLNAVTKDDVIKEGFPQWNQAQFIAFFTGYLGIDPDTEVCRIEFVYYEDEETSCAA